MIEKISNKILNFLLTENKTEEEKEILLFGITRIIEDIPKTIGIVIIGILLGIIQEIAISTLVIMLYKTLTGGVHAKTNWGCFFYSVLFYLAIVYSSKYIVLNIMYQHYVYLLIYIFSVYTIIVYVPADVEEIPKVNIKLRKILKIKSFVALNIIYVVTIFVFKNILVQNLIIYSIFYISLMTTRSIYKLFKTKYGFESYIPDELI